MEPNRTHYQDEPTTYHESTSNTLKTKETNVNNHQLRSPGYQMQMKRRKVYQPKREEKTENRQDGHPIKHKRQQHAQRSQNQSNQIIKAEQVANQRINSSCSSSDKFLKNLNPRSRLLKTHLESTSNSSSVTHSHGKSVNPTRCPHCRRSYCINPPK